jgi:AraC-like DNA-binding protein
MTLRYAHTGMRAPSWNASTRIRLIMAQRLAVPHVAVIRHLASDSPYRLAMIRRTPAATIRANVLADIVKDLRRQGAPVEALLDRQNIRLTDLADPYAQILMMRFVSFMEEAALVMGDASLGAKVGTRLQPQELGPIGLIFLAAPNLQAALTQLVAFYPVLQGGTHVELDVGATHPAFIYRIVDPAIWPRRQDAELTLSALCSMIRRLLGPRWHPLTVHFEHGGASALSARSLEQIFRAPVMLGQGVNQLLIDRQDLVRPVSRQGVELVPYMERHLMDLLRTVPVAVSCAAQVSYIIGKRLGHDVLDVRSIAQEIGLSARTLQRRLAEEGTSLRRLVQQHRSQVVDRLLLERAATITSIAHDVGYSDSTTFSRAFKSWRGRSPRHHRQPPRRPA